MMEAQNQGAMDIQEKISIDKALRNPVVGGFEIKICIIRF